VRRLGESNYTTLVPRQLISMTPPASPSSPSAGATCAHDHIGEVWNASIPWSNGAFKVTNSQNGPTIWGVNTGGGNAVRGDGTGSSIGVFGSGVNGPGVAGNSSDSNGVSGSSSAYDKSGVDGYNNNASGGNGVYGKSDHGYGVYGISDDGSGVRGVDGGPDPDDYYGVISQGDLKTTDDLYVDDSLTVSGLASFGGGKVGYVVEIAQNDDSVSLEPGDVVVISGVGPAVVGQIPVIKVRRATVGEAAAVIGVVDQHYIPPPKPVQLPGQPETKLESKVDNGDISPGEYLTVVTLGAFKMIKVDASYGAVTPGSLLVVSPKPGFAMRAASPLPGTIIGKALRALDAGAGVIPVIVTLQ
jgi:hypothetical protein